MAPFLAVWARETDDASLIGILALRTHCAVYGPVAAAGFTAYAQAWV